MNAGATKIGVAVFVLATLLRAGWVGYQWTQQGAALEFPDETLHWGMAVNLATRGVLATDAAAQASNGAGREDVASARGGEGARRYGEYAPRMPVYPVFLAAFAGFGEGGKLAAKLAQALCGGLTAWIAYVFACAALGRAAAVVAGLLIACDPFAVFFCNLLLTETVFTMLAVGLAAATWRLAAQRSWGGTGGPPGESGASEGSGGVIRDEEPQGRAMGTTEERGVPPQYGAIEKRLMGAGTKPPERDRRWSLRLGPVWGDVGLFVICGAGAVFTRQAALGWVMASWLVVWFCGRRGKTRVGQAAALAGMAGVVVPLLLWGMRNRAVIGEAAWLTTNGGVTLYDAQGPQADGSSDQSFLLRMPELAAMGEAERDRYLARRAFEEMRRDPARVVRLAWVKFLRTWNITPNYEAYRGGTTAIVSGSWMVLVMSAGLAGVIHAWRRRLFLVVMLMPVVYFTLVHCVYIGSVRYRVPMLPFVEMLAGAAVGSHRGGARSARDTEAGV